MTVIVGLVEDKDIYIGGDSAGVNVGQLEITIRSDVKVFTNGPFLIGGTTSFRMLQLLNFKFNPPKQSANISDMKYMVTDFIDSVRACFSDNGFGSKSEGGSFLVGYNGTLYHIDSDYQVGVPSSKYDSVGCGSNYALGSLFSSKGKSPLARVKLALQAANNFSAGVAPPFLIKKL